MTRILDQITSTLWAMPAGDVHLLLSVAARSRDERAAARAEEGSAWLRRDYQLMAGPGAQKLAGAQRAYVIDGVAILPVSGPVFPRANLLTDMSGATSITMLQNDYAAALASKEVGAIMLLVDSPGGAVSGIASFVDAVRSGNQRKPTSAFVASAAASAAYWITSAAGEVIVDRTSLLGSIGVIAVVDKQIAPNQDGEISVEIVSSGAPHKRVDPVSEDGAGIVRATIDQLEAQFIGDVAKGRNVSVAKVRSDFGQGGLLVGADAVRVGMADRVGSYETALRSARNRGRMQSLNRQTALNRLHIVGGSASRILPGENRDVANIRRMQGLRR